MATHMLDSDRWKAYLDAVNQELAGKEVDIEVAALDIGAPVEGHWIPLKAVNYDPGNDLMEILAGPLDHRIHHPREVYVDDDLMGLHSIRIIDTEGHRQILRLRRPMMLPMRDD